MSSVFAFAFGYLLGSIPFGLLLTRAAGAPDIRSIGSGNIGATNVLRTGRKWLAAITLFCDMFKGTVAVLVARHFGTDAALAAGLGAFVGHLFPVWLRFKGGKGVATYIGVLIGLYWPAALAFCVIWLSIAAASRYSSLAALIASALTPLGLWAFNRPNIAALFLVLTAALWVMHRENIARLLNGTEGKIGAKAAIPN
ncbi:MAG: glycerol-3-phosphate 1-O-acyltransferase PlsY [Pseudolabrys sp.]|jgi:glycerol-3-phosphate acyltransferase PlsY|nr:glycerol-3-phosphate 1-O-acyltransferase PlsY [Pseudolabrys sp.]